VNAAAEGKQAAAAIHKMLSRDSTG
jgi:hypothetical protein